MTSAFVWDNDGTVRLRTVCVSCAEKIRSDNRRRVEERVQNEMMLSEASRDYHCAMRRGSSREYLDACRKMMRELGL